MQEPKGDMMCVLDGVVWWFAWDNDNISSENKVVTFPMIKSLGVNEYYAQGSIVLLKKNDLVLKR
jgi:hypothetical protein